MGARTRPGTEASGKAKLHKVDPPSADVKKAQDPGHTEGNFLRDLDKATQRKPESS
jgi:hypothetical protein